MNRITLRRLAAALALAATVALAVASGASAHAHLSPPVVLSQESQVFTVAVPNEKDNTMTTQVEVTVPDGFSIDSFVASPGWKRSVEQTGSGEDAVVKKVTWTGGSVPPGEATGFSFLGRAGSAKTYSFAVRQTYSDGSVVDWTGPESSDTPAPLVEARSSFGDSGTSTLEIVAIVLGALGLAAGVAALVTRGGGGSGGRSLV